MEAHAGLFPLRGMLFAFLLEVAALATAIAYPSGVFRPEAVQPSSQTHDVIYFSADELPRTQDLAGGSAGQQGAGGGTSLQHRSQTIKVARGKNLRARVVDAPDLHLPKSDTQISNLLAYKAAVHPAPEPPPTVRPALVTPPILVHADHERRKQTVSAEVAPPKVSLPKNAMPNLPATSVTAIAPPPVAAPIKVTHNRAQLTLPASSAPKISGRQQMPSLPEANTSVQAPPPAPSPIKVAHSRKASSDSNTIAPPKIDASSAERRNDQLASIVASPSPDLPATLRQPVGPADSRTLGVIVTPNPGPKQAAPKNEEKTTVAMAHGGSTNLGSGGTGGGTGMQPGKGPGSSESGSSSGATTVGNDKGTDFYARNGNSPNLGPGGTGNLSSGTPRAPGVSVSGGKNSITLPSFGGPASPAPAGHSDIAKNMGNGITVIASPRAGGALNLYGALKGDRVYTIYINTRIGTAIMQFADPASLGHAYTTELTAPRVLQADVPSELLSGQHHSRVLIGCELDSNGKVKNAHVLQSDGSEFAQKMLLAIPVWKFTPATRGNQAVTVNAILGFGVDTQ
jgi:TonB family protein